MKIIRPRGRWGGRWPREAVEPRFKMGGEGMVEVKDPARAGWVGLSLTLSPGSASRACASVGPRARVASACVHTTPREGRPREGLSLGATSRNILSLIYLA